MPRPEDRRFLASLEGLRGLAALTIVLYHQRHALAVVLDRLLPGSLELLQPVIVNGRMAVDLFFILSGFILAYVYLGERAPLDGPSWRRYLLYRVARIYPLHLFMLALWVPYILFLVTAVHPEQSFAGRTGGAPAVIERIFLVHMWWHDRRPLAMNVPDWSISIEWACYLLFPLIVLLLRRCAREADAEGRALLPRSAALALLLAAFALAYLTIAFQKSGIHGYGYIWLFRGGCEFLIGIALQQFHARGYGAHVHWRR
ncbi:MAG: acyltransferase, partial [Rhodovibrionaceae bacterium]